MSVITGAMISRNANGVYASHDAGNNSVENNFMFGKRPLDRFPFKATTDLQDEANLGLYHEQGFYEDGSGDNVGYFGDSKVKADDPKYLKDYKFDGIHYDDAIMREAVDIVKPKPYQATPVGKGYQYNCQNYAEDLRNTYGRIDSQRNPTVIDGGNMSVNNKLYE